MTAADTTMAPRPPKLSIVTIVRNDRPGLERTRASVAGQTARDFEWIVIDGNSTDATSDLVAELLASGEARGISERDKGIYDAMNKGLARASGDYVVFLNAGDCFHDVSATAKVAARLEVDSPDIAYFSSMMDFGDRQIYRPAKRPAYVWHGQPGLHQATFIRRSLHQQHPFSTRYRICGDYDALVRMVSTGADARSYDDVISVNEFDAASTSGKFKMQLMKEAVMIQRRVLHLPLWKCAVSVSRRAINSLAFKTLTGLRQLRGS